MASSTGSTRQLLTLGGATLLTAALGYCVYFDYKRRNDPVFRKKLRQWLPSSAAGSASVADQVDAVRDHRKVHKATKIARASAAKSDADVTALLKQTVQTINAEPFPTTTEAKEEFFMEQAGIGEMLTQSEHLRTLDVMGIRC